MDNPLLCHAILWKRNSCTDTVFPKFQTKDHDMDYYIRNLPYTEVQCYNHTTNADSMTMDEKQSQPTEVIHEVHDGGSRVSQDSTSSVLATTYQKLMPFTRYCVTNVTETVITWNIVRSL